MFTKMTLIALAYAAAWFVAGFTVELYTSLGWVTP